MSREAIVENLLLTPAPPGDAGPIAVGSTAWFAWLSGATRFRLTTPQGPVTVRKERAGGGRGSCTGGPTGSGTDGCIGSTSALTLTARTEGWAAGLQLAALALHDAADPARVIAAFSGEHRLIADYLLSEVLAELPPHLRRFLRATALLERLSAPLCATVWDEDGNGTRAEAQQLLEELEQRELFLTPLDDTRCWYRYHGLFAELVRAELARVERPETIAALHLRAAGWYLAQLPTEGSSALEAAISHSLAGDAPARAAELVERAE